jgi:hypothetical protein
VLEVAALSSGAVGGNGGVHTCCIRPWQAHISRCRSHSKHVVLHASTHVLVQAEHRSPTQNSDIYGVCIDVMLLAGKLECGSSGQLFIRAWACSWCNGASPSGLNHYPGTHPLVSGANELNREANRVGFGFCSRATLACPNGKKF